MRPAVFLDRDNTIIHNDADLGDPAKVVLMKGAAPAIASLRGLGFRVVVVTNQGGVARGHYNEDDVHAVHDRIADLVAEQANGAKIDAFYYCPYHPKGKVEKYTREHPSRKPAPGMLLQAASDLKLDLPVSWMVGDALRDIEAGHAAGTRTILLHGAKPVPPSGGEGEPDFCASGMVEAVRIIAQQRTPESVGEGARPRKPGEPKRRQWDAKRIAELQHPREKHPGDDDAPGEGEDPGPQAALGPGAQADQRSRPPEFRPWSVGQPTPEKPIVPSPFRKRFFRDEEDEQGERTAPPTAAGPQPPPPGPTPPVAPASSDTASPAKPQPETRPKARPEPAPEPRPTPPPAPPQLPPVAEQPPPQPDPTPEPEPKPEPKAQAKPQSPADEPKPPGSDKVLRMILQELRGQRGSSGEFSYLTIIAVVLQIVAIICLLGALWMGGADVALFMRWLGVGLMAQLGVIATLMFGK